MSPLTTYDLDDGIATIAMDDGKANALSLAMQAELSAAFDRAAEDGAIVVLTGRERTFSGGFDLGCEPAGWPAMVAGGARLAERILSFPHPVIAACNGNAIAMAGFLLLSADVRIGTAGDFRVGLNEVAIGLTVPWFGIALAQHRLTRPYADRCLVTGALLDPEEARAAGFLDRLVAPERLREEALADARALAALDRAAHAATKLRAREQVLAGVRDGIERIAADGGEW
ncbi:MAG TPA: crotonase/enoyl-CoA hydratase family protein [Conexibacter sp.]|jgi:enoyl-CoA hydratase|nr:crotonase/enoyl-CoA hydratase family protein [Conexibacter sp.]